MKASSYEANEILENRAFQEAFDSLAKEYTKSIVESGPDETERREQSYLMLHNLKRVKRHLTSIIQKGKISRMDAREIENKRRLVF